MNRLKNFTWNHSNRTITNRSIIFSLLLILISVCPVFGATYYVKSVGNDSLDGLSDVTAWATIDKVQATVKSGDTVYFRSQDTWTTNSPPILKATAGVTYDGSTYGAGSRAKLTTNGGYTSNMQGVVHLYASNVNFKGFEVDANLQRCGGIYVGYMLDADIANVLIDNCIVHNTGGISGDWNYGIQVGSKSKRTIKNTMITNSTVYDTFHEGIAIYASWTSTGNRNDGVLVRGCTVYNTGTKGAATQGSGTGIAINNDSDNVTIEYCNIYNNNGTGIGARVSPPWEDDAEMGSSVLSGPNNMVIRYNFIGYNLYYGFAISNYRSYPVDGTFYGNVFYQNGKTNSQNSGSDFAVITHPDWTYPNSVFHIYNNTFYSTENPATNVNMREVISIGHWSGSLVGLTINFKNNIVYAGDYLPIMANKGVTLNHSNNLIFRSSGASVAHVVNNGASYDRAGVLSWEPTARNTDPLFVSGGTNFRLQSASPAIDAGASVGLTRDILGNPVPIGSAPDIGAYEYQPYPSSSTTTPPSTITGTTTPTTPTTTVSATTSTSTTATRIAKVKKRIFNR